MFVKFAKVQFPSGKYSTLLIFHQNYCKLVKLFCSYLTSHYSANLFLYRTSMRICIKRLAAEKFTCNSCYNDFEP